MSRTIEEIVTGFHVALDGGLPGESFPPALAGRLRSWVETTPEIFGSADPDSLEGYLIDEHEGVGPIVEFVETIPAEQLPAIFEGFRSRIGEFYSNSLPLDPGDELQKAAIDTLDRIKRYLGDARRDRHRHAVLLVAGSPAHYPPRDCGRSQCLVEG